MARIGNQIDAAPIFARADFVNVVLRFRRSVHAKCPRVSGNSDREIVTNVSKPSGEFNVCMGGDDGRYGWDHQRAAEPPAVIAISLRGLSSIKHAQESLTTSVARNHLQSGNKKRF
jgi:hypothetical protein